MTFQWTLFCTRFQYWSAACCCRNGWRSKFSSQGPLSNCFSTKPCHHPMQRDNQQCRRWLRTDYRARFLHSGSSARMCFSVYAFLFVYHKYCNISKIWVLQTCLCAVLRYVKHYQIPSWCKNSISSSISKQINACLLLLFVVCLLWFSTDCARAADSPQKMGGVGSGSGGQPPPPPPPPVRRESDWDLEKWQTLWFL